MTIETPQRAHAGRRLRIHFDATDNDLVRTCTIEIGRHIIGRLSWPASTFHWFVPTGLHGPLRITVVAVDRAGNRASATTRAFPVL